MLVKAGEDHPLSFRRGKLLLPATILKFGERPLAGAKRAVVVQLEGAESLEPEFKGIQSFMGSHWDLCFVYEFDASGIGKLSPRTPFVDASHYRLSGLPRDAVASDHLEVIDGLNPL